MASEIAIEPKRPLMPNNLLKAAIDGNETELKQLLGLNNEEQDQPPHTKVPIEDVTPMEPSDCLIRSAAGMEDTILHILSANDHHNLLFTICTKDSSLLKACNARNETPFHHAARFGHKNTISELIRCAKSAFSKDELKELLRQKNCLGETTLHEAARHGHEAVVSTLMEEDVELPGLVNNDFVSPLYLATARGSLRIVQNMVQNMVAKMSNHEIPQAFYSGPKKQTTLHAAVLLDPELTKELLRLYSEPLGKGADETGRTPLHFIASTGNHHMAELLLDKDPSLAYIQDSDGSFPVHTAVRMGHVKMIVLLLQRCPDSGQLLDGNGRNFLHIAIEANKSDVIFKLLNDLVNKLPISPWKKMFNRMANTMDNKGNTPLHLAAEHGYVTVMHYLLKNNELDLTLQNKEGKTAFDLSETGIPSVLPVMPNNLLKAAIDGNEAVLKELLGLNNNEEDHPPHMMVPVEDITAMEPSDCLRSIAGMNDTILHILSAYGHENLVSTICLKESSLLAVLNLRKETPFHHAARFGHVNTILKLIELAKSEFGEAELKELLRQKNCLGETALHEAARHGHGDVVSILMEEDLELAGLVNDDSLSPLYLATARGSLPMVQKMVAKMSNHEITQAFYSGPKQQTALHAAVLQDPELTKELLKLNSKEQLCKEADETKRTPLHFIASTGNHEIAELLLGKDPSSAYIPNSDGSFPVHTAVQMGHVKVIVLLLERCLDSGLLLDGNGRNFLHIAVEAKTLNVIFNSTNGMFNRIVNKMDNLEDRLPMSHWKKMFNRMVNIMDNKGNTPLHLAAEHGYIHVMLSLLEKNELDLTLQNKEGLTAFDVSVIQLGKHARTTQSRDILGEYYVRKRGDRISTGWFQYYSKDPMSKTELIRGTIKDHISTTEARGAKKSSEILMAKAQLVGLGSVLIATVTFAAAFTLPGGTNQDTGTPILGRQDFFRSFVLADFSAFFLSFLSILTLIYSSSADNPDSMERIVARSMSLFTIAARCMVFALAFGLYLVLNPIGNAEVVFIVVMLLSCVLASINNPFGVLQQIRGFLLERKLLKHIPDGASGVKHKDIKAVKEYLYFLRKYVGPTMAPLIFIFVFTINYN